MFTGTATFSDAGAPGEIFLLRTLHNQVLPCNEESDQIGIGAPKLREQCETLLYP